MCGIAGIFGQDWEARTLQAMVTVQRHRGPDDEGTYISECKTAGLGHNRLSIIDLTSSGHQPMRSTNGHLWISFNGEIYNYIELRKELSDYPFRTGTDTEVILAAYDRWGEACLHRFRGMFAFLIWDERKRKLFGARDRFGVKPLYYSDNGRALKVASEIKALHAAGVAAEAEESAWASYLGKGFHDYSDSTFWKGVQSLPSGSVLRWENGRTQISRWYDLANQVDIGGPVPTLEDAKQEYRALLEESVALRFRSDVTVGINLSGGLDSSILLGLVNQIEGAGSQARAYTFVTNDANYDEIEWVEQMLAHTQHKSVVCPILADEVPLLAESVQNSQDEPFGGLPTLAYAKLFQMARAEGTIVLLDGQGMDEQWAGYDYYLADNAPEKMAVQGSKSSAVRPDCLMPEFMSLGGALNITQPFPDKLRNLQYRDLCYSKIPRALRFNERASMRSSVELREPFLDHKLVEFAFRMPMEYKIYNGSNKWLLRQIGAELMPGNVAQAPKRPLQTPQREWLRGPLRKWAGEMIETALDNFGGSWLNERAVRKSWNEYCLGIGDNSFYIWQWISLGLIAPKIARVTHHV